MPGGNLTFSVLTVFGARIAGAVGVVISLLVLSRFLTPAEVGVVVTAQSLGMVLGTLGTLHLEGLALRFLPQRQQTPGIDRSFGMASLRTAAIGLPIAAAVAVLGQALMTDVALSMGALVAIFSMVPATAAMRVGARWGTGYGRPAQSAVWTMALRPVFLIAALGTLAANNALSLEAALWATSFSFAASAIGPAWITRGNLSRSDGPPPETRRWQKEGAILILTLIFLDRFPDVVAMLAGWFLNDQDVGLLGVALRLALIIRMLSVSLSVTIGPKVSSAIGKDDWNEAIRLADLCTLLMSAFGLALAAGLWIAAPLALMPFGQDYVAAASSLRILAFVAAVPALFGPSMMVLVASARTQATVRATIISAAILVAATGIGSMLFGRDGFCWGVVLGQASWSFVMARAVQQQTGHSLMIHDAVRRQWQRIQTTKTEKS